MVYLSKIKTLAIIGFIGILLLVAWNYFLNSDSKYLGIQKNTDSDTHINVIKSPNYYIRTLKGKMFLESKDAKQINARNVVFNYISGNLTIKDNLKFYFHAAQGDANLKSKILKLEGDVSVKNEADDFLSTKKMIIFHAKNKACAENGIEIKYQNINIKAESFCVIDNRIIKFKGPVKLAALIK